MANYTTTPLHKSGKQNFWRDKNTASPGTHLKFFVATVATGLLIALTMYIVIAAFILG
jgi:hypothetical protein